MDASLNFVCLLVFESQSRKVLARISTWSDIVHGTQGWTVFVSHNGGAPKLQLLT